MEINKIAMAGTLESSDISVTVEPNPAGDISIDLKSSVEKQFGKQIKSVIKSTLEALKVKSAIVRANDKGALDCVIKSRVEAAVMRAAGETHFNWGADI